MRASEHVVLIDYTQHCDKAKASRMNYATSDSNSGKSTRDIFSSNDVKTFQLLKLLSRYFLLEVSSV